MENIKIIAMDYDGTLLTSDKKVTDRTKTCLIDFSNKGYKIIGVTARNLMSVKNVLDTSIFDYIILNNGSDLYYVKDDRIENISNLDPELVKKIYDLYEETSHQIDFCTPHRYIIKASQKKDNRPFIKYIDGLDEVDESVSRMNIFFDDADVLEENRELLKSTFESIDVVKMIDTDRKDSRMWLTINPKNINKLNTLKKICNELGYTIKDVIFFGDGENDLILIENAGIGVAMDNAISIVKEKATDITSSNDEDGIAKYLEKKI